MTHKIYVCKHNDDIIYTSLNEDETKNVCKDLIKKIAEKNLLISALVPETLIEKGINNILLNVLNISRDQVENEMENITEYTCSSRTLTEEH